MEDKCCQAGDTKGKTGSGSVALVVLIPSEYLGRMLTIIDVDRDHPPMVYFESKISASTDSESSMAQVVKWFETCCEEHKECKPQTSLAPFVPNRLLEISGSDEGTMTIRLRERQTLPVEVRYTTLSHCWGSVMPFELKHELLESCLHGISLNEISRVFRDAVRVTWRLKIQYIWIDSLCTTHHLLHAWVSLLTVFRHHSRFT